ncbi:YqkE family protein [Rummeliibacillus stabekisii]|uniref:YqkE family protein n=1 Tax=Rummeliibacillus TaxID=648802 RepID=UPI00123902F6|nr:MULTISPECIES: YqkE family protein [Rummeliibacillus]MCM3315916.1 YqkE family protein [Rummeliibacillus stabekisii]
MAKKRKNQNITSQKEQKDEKLTLQDQLNGDVLEKLKLAKKELVAKEQQVQEEKAAQLAFERKQREKNKSFAELLDEYGDRGSKF